MILPKTPAFRLDGKRALVTSASCGIGLAAAAALAEVDTTVRCVAGSAEGLQTVCRAIRAAGGQAEAQGFDITDLTATAVFISKSGPFDVLVNSTGMARHSPALDTKPEDHDTAMDLNLCAAYFLTRELASGLIAADRPGSLINISSEMIHIDNPDRTVYAAGKNALEGITKAMAIESSPHGVRFNTLRPTFICTPLAEKTLANPERLAWILSKIKLGRVGAVEDIMGPIVFLATDASALMTVTHLIVDGGWTAQYPDVSRENQ